VSRISWNLKVIGKKNTNKKKRKKEQDNSKNRTCSGAKTRRGDEKKNLLGKRVASRVVVKVELKYSEQKERD